MDFEVGPRPPNEENGPGSSFLLDWMAGGGGSKGLAVYPQDKLDTETLSRARTTMWGTFEKDSRIELC
jgi:hypothetical protein